MKSLILNLFLFISISGFAQTARCPSGMDHDHATDQQLQNMLRIKRATQGNLRISDDEIIRIPVVVHVVHNVATESFRGGASANIPDQQIFSQIKVLNEDFRRISGTPGFNDNPVGADMGIEFYLATIDPNGNPTSGITRHYNPKAQWDPTREMSELTNIVSWDASRYLNIWVTNLPSTFLGLAQFPGAPVEGLSLRDAPLRNDGIYIDHQYFGRQTGTSVGGAYTYGRTTTHEVGHWLGLIHIWGDRECGTDYCDDTPVAEDANYEQQCFAPFSNCTGVFTRNMFENYMDYSADQCMNIFTQDQKARTRAVLELSARRRNLVENSSSLINLTNEFTVKVLNMPSSKERMAFQILQPGFNSFNIQFLDIFGRVVSQKEYLNYPSTVISFNEFSELKNGQVYIARITQGEKVILKRVFSI